MAYLFSGKISDLLGAGLEGELYAYHGTSARAVEHLAEMGRMPISLSFGCDLYIAPLLPKVSREDQLRQAKVYAQWSEWKVRLLNALPFVPADMKRVMFSYSDDGEYDALRDEAAKVGIGQAKFYALHAGSKRGKGVVLSLSKRIQSLGLKPVPGRSPEERILRVEAGLGIEYITGIEPLGDAEWKVIEALAEGREPPDIYRDERI